MKAFVIFNSAAYAHDDLAAYRSSDSLAFIMYSYTWFCVDEVGCGCIEHDWHLISADWQT